MRLIAVVPLLFGNPRRTIQPTEPFDIDEARGRILIANGEAIEPPESPKDPDVENLPKIAELADVIKSLPTSEILDMRERDTRKSAGPIYQAELEERAKAAGLEATAKAAGLPSAEGADPQDPDGGDESTE